jgi:PAP2 superfamily
MRMIRDSIQSNAMLAGVVAAVVSVALTGVALATPPSGATVSAGDLRARGLAASSQATADTVVEWNVNAANAIFVTAGQPPQQSVPHLAMVHGAVYDAVNAIDGSREGYLISARTGTPSDSKEAAAATAAYRVLLNIVPAQQATLDAQYAASLAAIPEGTSKTRGIAVGEAAAAAMIAARTDDGRFGPFRFAVGTAPGVWRPVLPAFVNDPNAWLKDVKPFLIQSSSQFRSKGPLALTSRRYAREFAEVKSLGSDTSTTRTADQTLAARYWAENPPATWSRIFRTLSSQQGLSIVENARLFAMLYMSGADALISVWDDKAHFSFWRPITAIREAGTDGNSATASDAAWLPLIPNPPYPEHSSGHTGLSGSFVATLRQFFGTNNLAWTDTNNAGLTRSFTRFSQAIGEIIDARVWSGIHFRTADQQGARIGRQVARWRQRHFFRPAKK